MLKAAGFLALAFALVVTALAVTPQSMESPKLAVLSCVVGSGGNGHLGLQIGVRNDSGETLKRTTWRASLNGASAWFDFADNSVIGPNETASHVLYQRILVSKAYYRSDVGNCTLVEAQLADGREWKAADFSAARQTPTPRPDDAPAFPNTIDNPAHDPVGIVSCGYILWTPTFFRKAGRGTLAVRFRNLSAVTIDEVVFRVPYLSGGFDFVDGGSFAPGVLVSSDRSFEGVMYAGLKLTRDLPSDLPGWYGSSDDNSANCTTVRVHFADGTAWKNPDVGPTEPPLPTSPPTLPPN